MNTGRMMARAGIRCAGAMALACLAAWAAAAVESDPLVERIRETPPYEVPLSQWRAWAGELQTRIHARIEAGRLEEARDLALFTANMLAGPGMDRTAAAALVRNTRRAIAGHAGVDLRSLFLAESEWLGRVGDREAIRRLMDEYRASFFYRPDGFDYAGGQGPGDPLRVRRPYAAGFDDPILTTMERHARLAGAGMDGVAPGFELRDIDGRLHHADMYRGRWVLLDFWVHATVARRRAMDAIASALRQWEGSGFSVLSVCQNLDADALRELRRGTAEMTWPQIDRRAGAELLRAFGIFGEIRNVLIGPDGRVAAHDVHGEDLPALLRRELGSPARQ